MKTQPWQLAQQISREFTVLEDLLQQQTRLEITISNERSRINKVVMKALEAFIEEHKQATTE